MGRIPGCTGSRASSSSPGDITHMASSSNTAEVCRAVSVLVVSSLISAVLSSTASLDVTSITASCTNACKSNQINVSFSSSNSQRLIISTYLS